MPTSLTLTEDGETQGWTEPQRHLIGWLATPRELRDPSTQQALAVDMGVSPHTLMNWKRRLGFKAQVRAACNQLVADTWLVDIYHAMYRQALEGNVPAARFLFEAAGIMGERAESGSVDRRVQFIIMPPGSTALPELAPAPAPEQQAFESGGDTVDGGLVRDLDHPGPDVAEEG